MIAINAQLVNCLLNLSRLKKITKSKVLHLGVRRAFAPQISISIKILGYEDIEENSGCRYLLEQSEEAKTTLKPSSGHKDGTRAEFLPPKLINLDLLAFSIFRMTRQLAHLCWGLRGRR